MKLQLNTRGVAEDPTLKDYVERRAQFALGRFSPRLRHVLVMLEDENGPKGGKDLRCRVELKLEAGDSLHVEEGDTHCRVAVDRALDRAARNLVRHLERLREEGRLLQAGREAR